MSQSAERRYTDGRQDAQPAKNGFIVCVICFTPYTYPVTFIRAHIEFLPAKVVVLYGRYFRTAGEGGEIVAGGIGDYDKPLLSLTRRLQRKIARRVLRFSNNRYERNALARFLVENKVDAVLAECGPAGVAAMDACNTANVPLIAHFHGNDAYGYARLERKGYPELFHHAASVVTVSRDMEKRLLTLGAPRERLFYNPCGVDTTIFQGGDPAQAPPVFLAVGRFVRKKGPDLTLRAFSKTVESVPEARLVMIGNGSQWQVCKQLAEELGIVAKVEFLGVKSHAEVAAAMKRVRALVQHSHMTDSGQSEGTPITLMEAGSSGNPVVATRHAGIPEVVIEERTGLLVDEGDIDGMARHMTRLARDPILAGRLGRAARAHIVGEFNMKKRIDCLWNIIGTAIKAHPRN